MDKMLLPTAFLQQLHRHVHKIQQLMPTGKLMNMAMAFLMLSTGLVLVNGTTPGSDLSFFYYNGLCPSFGTNTTAKFQNLTDAIVAPRIAADPGLAPASMRCVQYTTGLVITVNLYILFSNIAFSCGKKIHETHMHYFVFHWLDLELVLNKPMQPEIFY